ncbi:hypothetical protein A5gp_00043 [Alteromonas phage vB_AemP_PT15-A5]|nr:hypothetical protein A5gp_00043 [Alteromonas phage vB_AemP_PT15-A5]
MSESLNQEIREKLDRFFAEDKANLYLGTQQMVMLTIHPLHDSENPFKLIVDLESAQNIIKAFGSSTQLSRHATADNLLTLPDVQMRTQIDFVDSAKFRRAKLANHLNINIGALNEYLDGREEFPF